MSKPTVRYENLGLIDYKDAWDYQEKIFRSTVQRKIRIRNGEKLSPSENHIIFCEHPHVYTLGKSGDKKNLLLDEDNLKEQNVKYYEINRGGDITYHGPGQLVVYPIFDLDYFFSDIHKFLRYLEESVINTLLEYGIKSTRLDGLTGVWIDVGKTSPRKICAIGVKTSRWVTMHGIGFNINSDLSYFSNIIPCGIQDKAVTSMEKELGYKIDMGEVSNILKEKLSTQFDFSYIT